MNKLKKLWNGWYHEFIINAPDELNGFIATMVISGAPFPEHLHNKKFCGIVWCYAGEANNFESTFKPVHAMNPFFEHVGEMPYPAIQSMFDDMMIPGMQWYWRADFFKELGPEVGAQHLKFGSSIPTPLSQMHLYPISGAASRVGAEDTPWAYRSANYAGVIIGVDPDSKNAKTITNWCKDYWEALHPYSSGGAYSNFLMDEGQERVKASYKHNYNRLVEIKRRFDPNNLFKVNQNIKP
ncbi:MAG: BBE domain-containing protein [Cellulophaga sp.]